MAFSGSLVFKLDPRLQGLLFIPSCKEIFTTSLWQTGKGEMTLSHSVALPFLNCVILDESLWAPLFPLARCEEFCQPPRILGNFMSGCKESSGDGGGHQMLVPLLPSSVSLLPFLSALPLHPFAQQLEYSENAYQVLSVTFQTPPLFLRTPPILILEWMSTDCDICVRLWPKKGCTCWLSLVNSSAEDRKQISC